MYIRPSDFCCQIDSCDILDNAKRGFVLFLNCHKYHYSKCSKISNASQKEEISCLTNYSDLQPGKNEVQKMF